MVLLLSPLQHVAGTMKNTMFRKSFKMLEKFNE